LIGDDVVDFEHGREAAVDDGGDELLAIGVPKVNGRAPGPGDLPGAGDDDAQEMLAVDVLGKGFTQVVQEVVDDLFLLLEGEEFLVQLLLELEADAQLGAKVNVAQGEHDQAEATDVPDEVVHSA
jgi:hypothetical protein